MAKNAFGKEDGAKNLTAYQFDPHKIQIASEPSHPLFDKRSMEPVSQAFIDGIIDQGVIEPIIICKIEDVPFVVDGRRRLLGCRAANEWLSKNGQPLLSVPCVYKTGTIETQMKRMVMLNEHRQEDGILNRAEKANRLIEAGGYTRAEVSTIFNVSVATIGQWLSYLELPKSERDAIAAGEVSASKAKQKQREKSGIRVVTMKKKKDIRTRLIESEQWTDDEYRRGVQNALRWVLGESEQPNE